MTRCGHSNMSPRSLTEEISGFESFVKFPQLTKLQMKTLFRIQQTGLRQRVAHGREIITPNAGSLLSLEEGRLHKKVASYDRDIIWSEPFHDINTVMIMIVSCAFEMIAKCRRTDELSLFKSRLRGRRSIEENYKSISSSQWSIFVVWVRLLQSRV